MRRTCVIFDIDGTLIDSNEFDGRLYAAAIRHVLGSDAFIRPSWGDYVHVTDSGILRELCADNRVDPVSCDRHVRECFGDLVSDHLRSNGGCKPVPGAADLFETLCSHADFQVGIATGGWGHTARLKLAAAGYSLSGVPLKTADDHHERVGIMTLCRNELTADGRATYIGDADWDRRAAGQLGWDFVGVGQSLRGRCAKWMADFTGEDILKSLADTLG